MPMVARIHFGYLCRALICSDTSLGRQHPIILNASSKAKQSG